MLACLVLPQQAAAQNSVDFAGDTYTIFDAVATEGGTARFMINIESGVTFNLNTAVVYTPVTADLDDLGSGRPATFSGTGQSSYTIEVPIAEDDTVEENETFTVQIRIVDLPAFAIQATGTIIDNDGTPPPAVNISIAPASATEGGDIRFPVTLSTQLLEARTLDIGYTAGSGNTGAGLDDLGSDRPTTLTLPTGTTTVDLVVPTVDDTDDENDETFTVTLSLPDPPANPANTLNITTSGATGTINDNDDTPDAEVSIANASVAENAAAGTIGFTVSLDRAVDSDVTLAVAYAAVTATLGTDLGTRPTTVTIDRGQTEATLMVPVTNDAIVEGTETFTVTLSEGTTPLPDGVTISADNEATGTITDADTAGVSLSATDPPAASEGGTITFTVELDNPVAETFSLGWTASDGTATVDDDLDDQSGTVEIPANAETATFTIPVTNDTDIEDSETFTVALTGAPTGLVNIAPSRITVDRASSTGTINASDAPDVNTVTIGNRSVAENVSGGSVGFTVSLTRAVDSDVTLAVAYTVGTASLDDDLGTPLPPSVTIDQGTTSATLRVPIANEVLVEGNETFTVTLSEDPANPLPEGVEIGAGVATGTITNDDEAEIRTNVSEVNETGVSLTFRPGVTAPLAQDLALAWEVTGGTASAADFIQYAGSGTVTIPARQNSATILFFPRDDDLVEGSETLTLTFSPAPGTTLPDGVTFGRTTATATIRDSDEAVINLRVVADVSETDARLTFRPELNRRLTQDVTLSWEVTGGTASADDFSEYTSSGTVTIEAGRGGAPIRFFPLDDDAVEGDETLEVTISAALGTLPRGVNLGTTTTATATIADDDEAPVVTATVGIDDVSVAENGGNAEFTVSLTTAVTGDVVLDVIYEGSGDNPVELARDLGAGRPPTVTIEEGRTSATLLVPVNNDALVEGDETFTVTIRERMANPLPDGVTIDDGTATGTIVDNETGQVTLGPATLTAAENGEFTYTVSLSRAADDAVTVRWTAATGPGDTATVDDDLRETTGTVTFAARNNTAQEFTIRPVDDPDDEDNETFTVTLEVDTEGNNPLPTGVTIGTTNSSTATITDDDEAPAAVAPQITTQPTNQSVTVGENATFTVAATGTPTPTYQWRFEGSDISGATSASYTLSSAALTDAGDYTVVVTNTAGTVTSTAATLTVTPAAVAPQITTQPTDQSVTVGENATFTVAATGSPAPTYQWRFEGSDISGATSASYTLSSAALTDAGDYTVVVTNTAGTVTSTAATLTVTPAAVAPQITTQPTDQSVTVGGSATFTVAATGTPTPTYQWRFEGSDISGATSASYAISSAALTDAGDYTVVVTNTAGTVTSSAATLTVTAAAVAPQITTQPTDQSVTVGENATFTVAATGTPTPTYQWRFEGSDISGATSATYTLSSAALTDAGDYTVVVTNTAGTVTSSAATLTVTAAAVAPQITTQPTDQSVTVGENATFTVAATGTPTPTYQWRFEGSDISGATSASYTLSSAALTDAGDYTVVVTNTAGTVTSTAATLTVTAAAVAPQITTQPTDQSVTVGENATFTVAATGTPTPTYQWRFEGSDISGATSETYTLSSAALTDAGDYTVVVTNTAGTVTSTAATLTVTPAAVAPQITTQPTDQSVTVGENATFTVAATGTPTPTYQWRFEGSDISGATSASYTLSSAALTDAGDYTVVVTNTAGTVTSSAATLTVTRVVNARVSIADADPVAEGAGPARFTVTLSRAADSDVVLDVAYAAGSASLADLGSPRPATVTIETGATEATLAVPIFDDDIVEGEETFTVTLTVNTAPEGVTVADGVATGTIARTPEPSVLIEPRRIAAGTALRRHVSRFDSLTGTVTRSRLDARETRRLSGSKDLGDGALAVGGGLGESRWGAWIDGAWAGFDGTASGRQADVYGGVDYLGDDDWLIGALIGYEVADLEIGEATYRSDYTHLGIYGGARLSERLLFDGAVTYGTATPDIALGDVSASYDARRITARGALTGDFGLEYDLWTGSVKVQPRLGVLYSRERLGAFTDSAGGVAEREILELGRFSAGPRLTWDFDGVRVAGGARVQGDFRGLDDGTGGRLSGAADIGVNLDLTPRVTLGAQGDVDGIGVSDEFGSLGGKVELGVRF